MVSAYRPVPLDKRKRTESSCDKCKTRKQKCERLLDKGTCKYCEGRGLDCIISQPRKKRLYGTGIGADSKLALLESLVRTLLPDVDLSNIEELEESIKLLGANLPSPEQSTTSGSSTGVTKHKKEQGSLPYQQDEIQYIGPSSSHQFHLKLRRLIGNYANFEFVTSRRYATDSPEDPALLQPAAVDALEGSPNETILCLPEDSESPIECVKAIGRIVFNSLIDAFFDVIHPDFPTFHEASFRERCQNDIWASESRTTDHTWLCGLLCVLVLSNRLLSNSLPEDTEQKWWRQVQRLLPSVIFASNVQAVQALMLAALHLNNTEHRDACWNLTGTAVRISFVIGLHRDDFENIKNPFVKELRKRLWWILYAFEHMQVSSHDRPSAVGDAISYVDFPDETIIGGVGTMLQDYAKWSQRLAILFGAACRALNLGTDAAEEAEDRPLSSITGVLRDLKQWKEEMPPHLGLEIIQPSTPPVLKRRLHMLHIQHLYVTIVASRSALLHCATLLSKDPVEPLPRPLVKASETCIRSGRSLGHLLLKLQALGKFNALTWWDIFFTITSAFVLVLDLHCSIKQHGSYPKPVASSRSLLRDLAGLAARHLRNPKMPGTMRRWAVMIVDIDRIADSFKLNEIPGKRSPLKEDAVKEPTTTTITKLEDTPGPEIDPLIPSLSSTDAPTTETSSPPNAWIMDDNLDVWTDFSVPDDLDWRWDDIGSIIQGGPIMEDTTIQDALTDDFSFPQTDNILCNQLGNFDFQFQGT